MAQILSDRIEQELILETDSDKQSHLMVNMSLTTLW
jgi:hypothetical protein